MQTCDHICAAAVDISTITSPSIFDTLLYQSSNMEDEDRDLRIRPDTPLSDFDEDRLGYAEFAEDLATVLLDGTPDDEFVVGIHGQWGAGKSTVLSFVSSEIKERSEDDPIIIEFNPWWFSGEEDLFLRFFDELQAGLGGTDNTELREQIAGYASILSKTRVGSRVGVPEADDFFRGLSQFAEPSDQDLPSLKAKIESELMNLSSQVFVVIDDIDRLSENEIQQVFRLIKSVADFDNIIYVVAFERELVAKALKEEWGGDGEEYLEKIVQLPIRLPNPQKYAIRELFLDRVRPEVLSGLEPVDERRLDQLVQHGLDPLLNTPRDAIRLANAIAMTLRVVDLQEINAIDLIGIEALRLFAPTVYHRISTNPEQLTGTLEVYMPAASYFYPDEEKEEDEDIRTLFDDIPENEREPIKVITSILFPTVAKEFDQSISVHESDSFARRRRICDENMIDFYFRLAVPQEGISIHDIQALLTTENSEDIKQRFLDAREKDIDGAPSEAHLLLQQLSQHVQEIKKQYVRPFVLGLDACAKPLCEDDIGSGRPIPFHRNLLIDCLVDALRASSTSDRFNILKECITQTDALEIYIILIENLQENQKIPSRGTPEEASFLGKDEINQLQSTLASRISDLATNKELLDCDFSYKALKFWVKATDGEANEWISKQTETDKKLLQFLDNIIFDRENNRWRPSSPTEAREIIDLEKIKSRMANIDKEELTSEEQEIAEFFAHSQRMIETGGNPHKEVNGLSQNR